MLKSLVNTNPASLSPAWADFILCGEEAAVEEEEEEDG